PGAPSPRPPGAPETPPVFGARPLPVVAATTPASIVCGFALWWGRDRPLHPPGDGPDLERGVQVPGVAQGGAGGVRGVRASGPDPGRRDDEDPDEGARRHRADPRDPAAR